MESRIDYLPVLAPPFSLMAYNTRSYEPDLWMHMRLSEVIHLV